MKVRDIFKLPSQHLSRAGSADALPTLIILDNWFVNGLNKLSKKDVISLMIYPP